VPKRAFQGIVKLVCLINASMAKRSQLPETRDAVQRAGSECLATKDSKLTDAFIDGPISSECQSNYAPGACGF
jgi:hypothetical protein